jgi:hypothetical protein
MQRLLIMKTQLFVLVALAAGSASAGVRIETISRDIKTQVVDGAPQTVLVQDGKVRVSSNRSGGMILKGGVLYILDDKRKTYREMDKASSKATINQANSVMQQMQERMKNMPPAQREQLEKMMGANMPGMAAPGKPKVYTSKDTGKGDTVEGRKCRVWQMLRDGVPYEEVCVVPFSSLPGKENFEQTFKELAEAFEGLAGAVPGAGDDTKARSAIKGYPARVRSIENGKIGSTETVLKSWVEEAIPATTFDIPKGYKKLENPPMGMQGAMGPGGG